MNSSESDKIIEEFNKLCPRFDEEDNKRLLNFLEEIKKTFSHEDIYKEGGVLSLICELLREINEKLRGNFIIYTLREFVYRISQTFLESKEDRFFTFSETCKLVKPLLSSSYEFASYFLRDREGICRILKTLEETFLDTKKYKDRLPAFFALINIFKLIKDTKNIADFCQFSVPNTCGAIKAVIENDEQAKRLSIFQGIMEAVENSCSKQSSNVNVIVHFFQFTYPQILKTCGGIFRDENKRLVALTSINQKIKLTKFMVSFGGKTNSILNEIKGKKDLEMELEKKLNEALEKE